MIRLKQAIVVEGKYDQIKLSSIVDAVILVTNGFRIFKDKEMLELIRFYARNTGIILLTDADHAGFQIRNYIKGAIHEGTIYHVYTPDIYGKERRKEKPSAEGKLGVEGIQKEVLLRAFENAGIFAEEAPARAEADIITQYDLFEAGLMGGAYSRKIRAALQRELSLPERLSAKALLEVLNVMYTKAAFMEKIQQLLEE